MIYTIVKFLIFFILIALIILNWFVDVCTQNKLLHEYCIQQNLVYVNKGLYITVELNKNTMLPFITHLARYVLLGWICTARSDSLFGFRYNLKIYWPRAYKLLTRMKCFLSTFEIDQLSIQYSISIYGYIRQFNIPST